MQKSIKHLKDIEIGQFVFSKKGRDKALAFVVVSIEENYVFLVDGDKRKFENPKKKKMLHIQHTSYVDNKLKHLILSNNCKNSDFRGAIKEYLLLKER